MKHNWKITAIILGMFLIAQFIGLLVVNLYTPVEIQKTYYDNNGTKTIINETANPLPYGLQPPEVEKNVSLFSIIISFAFAIMLILILSKYKWRLLIKLWFFAVIIISLGIAFNALIIYSKFSGQFMGFPASWFISLAIAIPLASYKVFKPNFIVHNSTELLIYPGISAIFVPILNIYTVMILLIIISIYDMWAVWHSGIMQKMAKFQMEELKIFSGFFIPYLTKGIRDKIARLKKLGKKDRKKIKVSVAILGGGDVVFPIITAGVFMRAYSFIPALFIIFGAFLGLTYLFIRSEKKKFYPAMPFITAGIFLGILLWKILF